MSRGTGKQKKQKGKNAKSVKKRGLRESGVKKTREISGNTLKIQQAKLCADTGGEEKLHKRKGNQANSSTNSVRKKKEMESLKEKGMVVKSHGGGLIEIGRKLNI